MVPGRERRADRRREQQGHSPGLAFVPGADWALGVLRHLRVGRASGGGLSVSLGFPLSFHLSAVEAHGRIVVQTVREAMRSSLSRLASADQTREATWEGRNVEKSCERTSEPFLDLIISRSGKTNLAGARICKLERKSARQVCCAAMKPFRRSGVTATMPFTELRAWP